MNCALHRRISRYLFLSLGCWLLAATATLGQRVRVVDDLGEPLSGVLICCAPFKLEYQDDPDRIVTNEEGRARLNKLTSCDSIYFGRANYDKKSLTLAQLQELNYTVVLPIQYKGGRELDESLREPFDHILQDVTVNSSRYWQDRKDVPHRVAPISGNLSSKFARPANPQTSADLLAESGEVYVQKSQLGGGSPMIRGFSANRVLIVVDGIRMNNAIFRSGNLQNVISIDPLAIDNTTIIFGPGAVQFGTDAIGGVMNFHTLRLPYYQNDYRGPTQETKTRLNGSSLLRFASANQEKTSHAHLSLSRPNFASVSSITYSQFGDQKMGKFGPDEYLRPSYVATVNGRDEVFRNTNPRIQKHSGYEQLSLMQKVKFYPIRNYQVTLTSIYSITSDIPRYDRLIEASNGQPRFADWYYGPQTWFSNSLRIWHYADSGFYTNATLILGWQHFKESRHDRRFRSANIRHQRDALNAYTANLDFRKSFGESYEHKYELLYGAEVVLNNVRSRGEIQNLNGLPTQPDASRYPDGSSYLTLAAYATHQYRITEKTTLQAGTRFTQINLQANFDTTFFPLPLTATKLNTSALNGSVGLTHRPDKNWQLNLTGSTGFRAPNIDDIGKIFESAPGFLVVPNPNLKPEYAWNAEAGITNNSFRKVLLELTGYYTYLDNALVRRNFQLNGSDSLFYDGELSQVQAIQNAAHAYVWGVQAGVIYQLSSRFTFTARYNYQHGKEEDEAGNISYLRHAAPTFGVLKLNYTRNRLQAELNTYRSEAIPFSRLALSEREKPLLYAKDQNGNPYAPAWQTVNFKLGYTLSEQLDLTASIENITDRRYRTYSSGIAAPGRNFILSLKANF